FPVGSYPHYLTEVGGTLFFAANDGTNSLELWKSNGTADGTVLVKDINPGGGNNGSLPNHLTAVGGTLYFTAFVPATGIELWKSDGTEAGTVLVKDINPGSACSRPHELAFVNGALFFAADDGRNGIEPWVLDFGPAVSRVPSVPGSAGVRNPTGTGGAALSRALDDVFRELGTETGSP